MTAKPLAVGPRRAAALVALGGLSLLMGALVYLTDRPTPLSLPLPAVAPASIPHLFGVLGLWLPSLAHVLAFSLFSAALLAPRAGWQYGACAFWLALNAAFEVGQHPQVRGPLAESLRHSLGQGPVARALENYFLRGTFDVGDLAAAALGAAMAAAILYGLRIQPENPHAP